jgi:DNA invertase Pin-like site-specific DNA recombinase
MFGGLFSGLANVGKGIFGGIKSGVGKLGAMGGQGEGMEGLSRGQKAAKIGATMLGGGLQGMGGGSSSSQAGQQFGNSIFGAMRGGDDEEGDSPGGIRALGGIFGKAGKMFGGKPNLPTAPNTPTATLPMTPGIDAQPRFTGNVQVPEGPSLLGQSGANAPNLSMEDILQRQKMDRQIPAILGDTERIAQVQSDILNPVSVSNQQGSTIPERNVPRPMIPRLPGQKGPQIEYDPRKIPAYARLKELIDAEAFDVFIFYNRGRLGRIAALSMAVVGLCEEASIIPYNLEAPPPSLDYKPSASDRMVGAISSVSEQEEVIRLVARHTSGMVGRINDGKFAGTIPFGWYVANYNERGYDVEINEPEAAVIRQIFKMYLDDRLGVRQIADRLNEQGAISVNGEGWTRNKVSNVFRMTKRYAGINEYNRRNKRGMPTIEAKGRWPATSKTKLFI